MNSEEYDAVIVAKDEPHLSEVVYDLQNQTLKPKRIICVVAGTQQKIDGVEWIKQTITHGPALARNIGISVAESSIIAGFDADIRIPEWYMEKAIRLLKESRSNIISGSNYVKDGNLLDKFNYHLLSLFSRFLDKCNQSSIIGNNYVGYRTDLLEVPFRIDMNMIEDADLSRRFRKRGKTVRFFREIYVYTTPRRIYRTGGWWRYLILYFKAYKEYRKTGSVKGIKYFE